MPEDLFGPICLQMTRGKCLKLQVLGNRSYIREYICAFRMITDENLLLLCWQIDNDPVINLRFLEVEGALFCHLVAARIPRKRGIDATAKQHITHRTHTPLKRFCFFLPLYTTPCFAVRHFLLLAIRGEKLSIVSLAREILCL